MLLATGVDIVSVERIERLLKEFGDRFIKRVFPEGIGYCFEKRKGELVGCIAARFALKEAVIKACSSVGRDISYGDVEILGGGKSINLKVKGCEEISFKFSISHERAFAVAVVNLWLEEEVH